MNWQCMILTYREIEHYVNDKWISFEKQLYWVGKFNLYYFSKTYSKQHQVQLKLWEKFKEEYGCIAKWYVTKL